MFNTQNCYGDKEMPDGCLLLQKLTIQLEPLKTVLCMKHLIGLQDTKSSFCKLNVVIELFIRRSKIKHWPSWRVDTVLLSGARPKGDLKPEPLVSTTFLHRSICWSPQTCNFVFKFPDPMMPWNRDSKEGCTNTATIWASDIMCCKWPSDTWVDKATKTKPPIRIPNSTSAYLCYSHF